ncbi:MAG: aminodeoxychorismate synthase component I [Rikenellaceae bacterium]
MESVALENLRIKMNEGGRKGHPFIFCVDYELNEAIFIENPMECNEIMFDINGVGNFCKSAERVIQTPKIEASPIPFEEYERKFEIIEKALKHGNSFLANLTVATPIKCNLTLEEIAQISEAKYKIYIPNRFCCFSPEPFVTISPQGTIRSFPMKGTIDATLPNAEQVLINDQKELQEHNTIVDLIRNDLSRVAKNVRVERFRYIERIESNNGAILQASSEIAAELASKYKEHRGHIGDIILELLPAGSISGAPKQSTIKAIEEAEQEPRGFYTGVFGYFDGEKLDSSVMIRYIEQQECGTLRFRSGGGVTANSNCRKEYDEMLKKIYIPTAQHQQKRASECFIETIKIVYGALQLEELHQLRAEQTAKAHTFTTLQIDFREIERNNPHKNGVTKCRVIYNADGVCETTYEQYKIRKIERLKVVDINTPDHFIDYKYKKLDRSQLDKLRKSVGAEPNEELIICHNAKVCDTSYSNLAFEKDGALYTPTTHLLNGVKRQSMINNGTLIEREITIEDIKSYDRVLMINAMLEPLDIALPISDIVY